MAFVKNEARDCGHSATHVRNRNLLTHTSYTVIISREIRY